MSYDNLPSFRTGSVSAYVTACAVACAVSLGLGCDREGPPVDQAPVAVHEAEEAGEGSALTSATSEPAVDEETQTSLPAEPEPPVVVAPALPTSLDISDAYVDEALGRYVIDRDNGDRIVLTLHPELHDHLSQVVRRYDEPAEALVAIEPSSGRVLAWVEDHSELSPTENPAASAEPFAASIFKIISAAALIEEVNLGLGRNMCVPPGRRGFEDADLVSNRERDTRCVDLIEAMAHSVNVYFARLIIDHLTPQTLESWLDRFAFNTEIPFEIEVEPSVATVPRNRLERARLAAGFRHAHLSPFHGALIAAAVANGGTLMRPTVVEQILDSDGETVYQHEPAVWREVMSPSTARTLTQAMSQTTIAGTAKRYFADREGWPDDLLVAGKTGTLSNRSDNGSEPAQNLIYSWFVGFAPLEAPEVAVAGLVYHTERWHIKGAYLASEAIIRLLRR